MFRSLGLVFCVVVMAAFVFGCGGGGGTAQMTDMTDMTDPACYAPDAGRADRCGTDRRCEASDHDYPFERSHASAGGKLGVEFDTDQRRRHGRSNHKRRQSQCSGAKRRCRLSKARTALRMRPPRRPRRKQSWRTRESGSKDSEHSRIGDNVHPWGRASGRERSQGTGNGRARLDGWVLAHPDT